jgi:hypothetical protein
METLEQDFIIVRQNIECFRLRDCSDPACGRSMNQRVGETPAGMMMRMMIS